MITITINEEAGSTSEMVHILRKIADLVEQGNTSGFYPSWNIKDQTERDNKIEYIKNVLSVWGMTSTAELVLEASPVYQNMNGRICSLVEEFTEDYVRVVTYDDEVEINEEDVEYEKLSDDLIDEIYQIMQNYEAEQEKTQKRISN